MKENRIKRVTIRFTETEYERLIKAYKKSTCRELVAYARRVLGAKPVTVLYRNQSLDESMQELIRLRRDLNAIGNNFNQIVKKINSINDRSLTQIWLPYAQTLQKDLITRIQNIQQKINEIAEKWLQ